MKTRTLILALVVLALCACAGRAPDREYVPPDQPVLVEPFDPGCGQLADPSVDLFDATCSPGDLARYDGADGTVYVYRCDADGEGWVPMGARCRWYGDQLWCGCGLDDGAGPAP